MWARPWLLKISRLSKRRSIKLNKLALRYWHSCSAKNKFMKGYPGMARILSLSVFILALASVAAASFGGKVRRDPLTSDETDQLREQAQEPVKRLRLYIK